jgi:hypothetical protein
MRLIALTAAACLFALPVAAQDAIQAPPMAEPLDYDSAVGCAAMFRAGARYLNPGELKTVWDNQAGNATMFANQFAPGAGKTEAQVASEIEGNMALFDMIIAGETVEAITTNLNNLMPDFTKCEHRLWWSW